MMSYFPHQRLKHLFLFSALVLISILSVAQDNSVAIGSTTTKANAVLWLNGDGTQGLLLPSVSSTGDISSPDVGMIVYQTSDNSIYYFNGGWQAVGSGGTNQTLNFNASTGVLTISGSNSTVTLSAGGDLTGNLNNLQLAAGSVGLTELGSMGAGTNQILVYNGSSWVIQDMPSGTFSGVDVDGTTITGDGLNTPLSVNETQLDGSAIPNLPDNSDTNETITSAQLNGTMLEITEAGNLTQVELSSLSGGSGTDQTLDLTSNQLTISGSGGNSVDLSGYLDNTDAQNLAVSGGNLNISGGAGVALTDLNDGDNDPANEIQDLTFSSGQITLSNDPGNTVIDISAYDTNASDDLTTTSSINDLADVNTTGIADGKVLKASGGQWVIGDDNSGGTPTVDNTTIEINGSSQLQVMDGGITSAKIANGTIVDNDISSITTAVISDITSVGSGAIITNAERALIGTNETNIATNASNIAANATAITSNTTAIAGISDTDDQNLSLGGATGSASTGEIFNLNIETGTGITITEGTNIAITRSGTNLTIGSTAAASGEANTASSVGGAGVGLVDGKVGVDLQFKNINTSSGTITVTDDPGNSEIDLDVNEAALTIASGQVTGLGTMAAQNAGSVAITGGTISGVSINSTVTGDGSGLTGITAAVTTDGSSITGTGEAGTPLTIPAGGITAAKLAAGSVSGGTGGVITDGTITNADINTNAAIAVTKLATGTEGDVLQISGGVPTWSAAGSSNDAQSIQGTDIDPAISGATDGQVLKWNNANSRWELGSDDTGGGGAPTLSDGQVIVGNGASNSAAGVTGDLTMSGAANFQIAADAVTTTEIADGTITGSDISSSADITANSFTGDGSGLTGVTAAVSTDGSSITGTGEAGTPLTIPTGGVNAAKLAAGAVSGGTGGTITDNSITGADISTTADITANSFTGDGSGLTGITASVSTDGSTITGNGSGGSPLTVGSITSAQITDGTITSTDIANSTITNADIAAGAAIDVSKINGLVDNDATNEIQTLAQVLAQGNSAGTAITNVTDPTNPQDAATKAYVDANAVTPADEITITASGGTGSQLEVIDASIDATKLATGAVSGGAGGVISDNTITDDDISSITTAVISDAGTLATLNTVGSAEITDGTITDADVNDVASSKVTYDPTVSGLTATDVKAAIDEVAATSSDDQTATEVSFDDTGTTIVAGQSDVQGAILALDVSINGLGALSALDVVGSAEISDGTVTGTDIAANTVVPGNIAGNVATNNSVLGSSAAGVVQWVEGAPNQIVVTDGSGNLTFVNQSNFMNTDQTSQTGVLIGNGSAISGYMPANNTIQKGDGTQLTNSNITDDGTTITLGSEVLISDITNPPGVITDKLYNNAGVLYWNGNDISSPTNVGLHDAYANGSNIELDGTANIEIWNSGSSLEYFNLDNNGTLRLGDGASIPDVRAQLMSNNASTAPMLHIQNQGTGDASLRFWQGNAPIIPYAMGVDATDGFFKISNGNDLGVNDRFVINSIGDVGINTSSPASKFHIAGDPGSNVGMVLDAVTGFDPYLDFYEQGILSANIFWSGSSDVLNINSIGSNTTINPNGGNVGIGENTPTAKLSVRPGGPQDGIELLSDGAGNAAELKFWDGNEAQIAAIQAPTTLLSTYVLTLPDNTPASDGYLLSSDMNGVLSWSAAGAVPTLQNAYEGINTLDLSAAEGNLQIRNSDGTLPYLTILEASGNVGIGTAGPSLKLLVEDDANGTNPVMGVRSTDASGDGAIGFGATGGVVYTVGIDKSDGDKFKISNGTSLGTADRIVINSSGNVGIGINSPEATLHAYSNSGSQFQIGHPNQPSREWVFGVDASANFTLTNETSGLALGITSSNVVSIGNLGTGIVKSNASGVLSSAALLASEIPNLNASKITAGTLPVARGGTGSTSFTSGSVVFSNGSALTQDNTGLYFDASTNRLGIGTNSPEVLLDVRGTGTSGASSDGMVNFGTSTGAHLTFDSNEIQAKNGVSGFNTLYVNHFGGDVNIGNGDIFLDNTNREVGIGTTTPANELDVEGSMAIGAGYSGTIAAPTNGLIVEGKLGIGTSSPDKILTIDGGTTNGNNTMHITSTDDWGTSLSISAQEPSGGTANAYSMVVGGTGNGNIGADDFAFTTGLGLTTLMQFDQSAAYDLIIPNQVSMGANFNPAYSLDVRNAANYVARFNRTGTDGSIIYFANDGTFAGSISVSGTTVSYNAFTGSHYGWSEKNYELGQLITLTGENREIGNTENNEPIYGITLSSVPNDPKVLGAYLERINDEMEDVEDAHWVMAVGNGVMWVVDNGEDIEVGDYLISSGTKGHAMLDKGEYDISYVVGRAGEDVKWTGISQTIDGKKHKLISVFYENFIINHKADRLANEVDELKGKTTELEAKLNKVLEMLGTEAKVDD